MYANAVQSHVDIITILRNQILSKNAPYVTTGTSRRLDPEVTHEFLVALPSPAQNSDRGLVECENVWHG